MPAVNERQFVDKSSATAIGPLPGRRDIMERRAASRLHGSPYPEVRRVTCEFHEGLLFLRGQVPSYFIKQIAQTAVLGLDGVDEIHNQLEVVAPPDGT